MIYYFFNLINGKLAKEISQSIINFCIENKINEKQIVAVGCDGTNANVGIAGGAIRLLKVAVNMPLQWIVCQLHDNELPLRHIIKEIDGVSTGPDSFTGPIGRQLKTVTELPLVTFKAIQIELP